MDQNTREARTRAYLETLREQPPDAYGIICLERLHPRLFTLEVFIERLIYGPDGCPMFGCRVDGEQSKRYVRLDYPFKGGSHAEKNALEYYESYISVAYVDVRTAESLFPKLPEWVGSWWKTKETMIRNNPSILDCARAFLRRTERERIVSALPSWEILVPSGKQIRSEALKVYLDGMGTVSFERALELIGLSNGDIADVSERISHLNRADAYAFVGIEYLIGKYLHPTYL